MFSEPRRTTRIWFMGQSQGEISLPRVFWSFDRVGTVASSRDVRWKCFEDSPNTRIACERELATGAILLVGTRQDGQLVTIQCWLETRLRAAFVRWPKEVRPNESLQRRFRSQRRAACSEFRGPKSNRSKRVVRIGSLEPACRSACSDTHRKAEKASRPCSAKRPSSQSCVLGSLRDNEKR